MGFIMEGLDAESYDRTYDDRGLVERILRYFKPNRRAMGLIVVMIVLNSAMDALLPVLISSTINQIDGAEEVFGRRIWMLFLPSSSPGRSRGVSTMCASLARRRWSAMWCCGCATMPFGP